ncbi:MAG TPA: hypothetical protein VFU12_01400 [Glycomyces sp.]|nr:hypothetical protein [Glycomyces sp.]
MSDRQARGVERAIREAEARGDFADLPAALDALDSETAVRAALADLNARIRKALIGPIDGPPLPFGPIDTDQALADWKRRRT